MCRVRFSSIVVPVVLCLSANPLLAWNLGQWKESVHALEDPALMTLEQVAKGSFISTKRSSLGTWRETGASCLLFSDSETVEGGKDLLDWNPETDEKRVILTADKLIPEGSEKPLSFRNPVWSTDRQKLLLYTNTQRVWRVHSRGDYWVLNLKTHKLQQLGAKFEPSTLMFAKFSPDSTRVAYVHDNNVYVENLKRGKIKQLTKRDKSSIINGTVDWAYEEEFGIRDGFKWSPNGKRIAYFQFDTEGVGSFHIVNYLAGNYSQVIDLPYPKVGTTNSAVRVGVVGTKSGKTEWLDDLPGDHRQHYIPRFYWGGNSKSLVLQRMNRLQNTNTLWMANLKKNTLKPFFVHFDQYLWGTYGPTYQRCVGP